MELKIREIKEGNTRLLVPEKKMITKKSPVFYNPEMELNRDISVAFVKVTKSDTFCDLLSGSGARGVRIANETNASVLANDVNPLAYDLIKRNMELNSLEMEVSNLDGNALLSGKSFDFVDIDPFGSPVRFVESAIRSIKKNGILAATATDTAALCGTYPRACRRKYDSTSLRTEYYNELGLRILIGFIAREALRYEKGIIPLFSHCTRHYFRTYVQIRRGGMHIKNSMNSVAFVQHCFNCLNRRYSSLDGLREKCDCGSRFHTGGPLWIGDFADVDICKRLSMELESGDFNTKRKAMNMINVIAGEQSINNPYYDLHKLFKRLARPAKPMGDITESLEKRGFRASRTHFCGTGLRTDANVSSIITILNNLQ